MSVRVVERLGWRRRGAPSAICVDPGRMTPVDAQRDCDARGARARGWFGAIRGSLNMPCGCFLFERYTFT